MAKIFGTIAEYYRKARNAQVYLSKKVSSSGKVDQALDAADELSSKVKKAQASFFQATADMSLKIINSGLRTEDFLIRNTPYINRIGFDIEQSGTTKNVFNPLLKHLGFDSIREKDAVDYLNQNTDYKGITTDKNDLRHLSNFGVDDGERGMMRMFLSIGTKEFARDTLKKTVSQALPSDPKEASKVIAFQAFILNNADLLIGDEKSHRQLFQDLANKAVENSNILPLAFIRKYAGISIRGLYRSEAAFDNLLKKVKDTQSGQEIAQYLNSESLRVSFPEVYKQN